MNVKERVALFSVIAAVLLTTTKLTVGAYTNSLGIISEALHSGIDLIAAVMTLFAVRAAARPPDEDYMYGHEKVESLSSLGEVVLLFITAAWIVYEAVNRLVFGAPHLNLGWSALAVMLLSVIVDFTRSRALLRTAKKYKSQALEADGIHFSTDLICSVVVIIGFLLTMGGMNDFDSYAALGVAAVTVFIGYRLFKKSVRTLLDGAPTGISAKVTEEILAVAGIHRVERVRVRESGPRTFIEATVRIDQFITLEQGHRLTDIAEDRIKAAIPSSDVILHAEPICLEDATLEDRIRAEASTMAEIKSVHNIAFTEGHSGRVVELHIELDGDLTVMAADELARKLEDKIKALDPCIHLVASHIEPVGCPACQGEASEIKQEIVAKTLSKLASQFPEVLACRDLHVHDTKNGLRVFLCCQFDPQMSVARAHELVHILEGHIRSQHEEIENVNIRLEPCCSIISKGEQGPSGDHKGTLS